MNNKIKSCIGIFFILTFIWTISACKKVSPATGTDKELFDLSKDTIGFFWYKNSNSVLKKSSGSAHSQPFLRTRYNSIAAAMLDSSGRIKNGVLFPEGSLIVKELFNDQTTIGRYAILYKKQGSVDADANGWIWGYINTDGTVADPASDKGSSCKGCHSQTGSIDYMLMNKYFP